MKNVFFVSSKKLLSLSRYSSFLYFSHPLFLPVSYYFRGWSKVTLKVYDIINCLNNNFITHSVWYLGNKKNDIKKPLSIDIWVLNNVSMETLSIDRVLHKESFLGKIMQKMCTNKFSWIPKTVAVCKKLF